MTIASLSNHDLTRYRGDTKRVLVTVRDDAAAVVDVTGWSFIMTINSEANPDAVTNQVGQIAGILDNPTGGQIHFPFTAIALNDGEYFYDIQATDTNGEIETIAKAKLTVYQDITK